jgi:tetratricopeptide (TPR) repeat protein
MPCPNCGATLAQSRPDGRCVGCGKLLPTELRAPAQSATSLRPDPAFTARYDLATAHLKQGGYEQAVAEYTVAIRLDPKSPNAHLGRALAYRSLGDEDNALQDERAARELGGAEQSTWGRLVNRAYQLWRTDRQASRTEFYQGLHPIQRNAVQLWDLNSQVFNGGFPQWLANGFGAWIEEIIDSVRQIGTKSAKAVQSILEGVARLDRECKTQDEADQNMGGLLEYTDRYYAVASDFADDVEVWLEEQLRRHP